MAPLSRALAAALPVLLVLLGGGCASTQPAAKLTPRRSGPALPYRLLVAMPEQAYDSAALNRDPSQQYSVNRDPASLQRALLEGLRSESVFEEVDLLAIEEKGLDPMEVAAGQGADLVLHTRVKRRVASYVGKNGYYIANLFVWFMAWIPSWWVVDETYALEIEVEAELRSVHSGRSVFSRTPRARVERDLDDFERGWQFLGIVRVPGSLGPENWRSVDRTLAPETEADLAGAIGTQIRQHLEATAGSEEFQRAFSRRYAVVIGVSDFEDYAFSDLRFAAADAEDVMAHVVERDGIPVHNTRKLVNTRATRERIREAIEGFVRRGSGEDDEVLIYFAGYGAWKGGKAYLVTYDTDSERIPETALPLDDLVRPEEGAAGPSVTLILDAPFLQTEFRGREAGEPEVLSLREGLQGLLRSRRHRVLTACQIGEGSIELDDFENGLFTHYLLEGLAGRAGTAGDDRVTWEEAFEFAKSFTEAQARLENKVQTPGYYKLGEEVGRP